jgi:hypothetical protein
VQYVKVGVHIEPLGSKGLNMYLYREILLSAHFPLLGSRATAHAVNHVGFVVDKVTVDRVFSECFNFPCNFYP